ncbi:bacterial bifunctional deaminase-reductase [Dissophora ornata]|nr:2,5-diamino-6-(ribosylamino)-4(3H)-pyrimidinone 5'-phosphate reductase [Dissophora ornata]KAI8603028.1 bacterial bifunctional deaminase-reductase [Dissophora ornata]
MATDYRFLFDSSFTPVNDAKSPHVTLTYAQSLDGKMAGIKGKQLILSGPESMKATHVLRSKHDAILVGIGTVLNDDPRLTVRLNSDDFPPGSGPIEHPQPIVLDSSLQFPTTAKLVLPTSPKKPWIFTGPRHDSSRKSELEALGAKVIILNFDPQGYLSITDLLSRLYQLSVRSLMVEGGAGIITSFLKSGLVDSFVLTIAPVYVGTGGISAVKDAEVTSFVDISYHTLGRDIIMTAKPQRE